MPTLDSAVVLWVGIAILAAIIEISIPHFGVIFVSLGAAGGALAGLAGFGLPVQIAAFIALLAASWVLVRPRVLSSLAAAPGVPSRTQALVGTMGVVTEGIDPTIGAGRINVGGQDWAARSAAPLATGTRVRVVGADGIVLEVVPT